MPLPKPLNNNVLIEITREYDAVVRTEEDESHSVGIVRDFSIVPYHLTASAALRFQQPDDYYAITKDLDYLVGKTVRWEQYAEGGQTFVQDGKTYAFVPWWRLLGIME